MMGEWKLRRLVTVLFPQAGNAPYGNYSTCNVTGTHNLAADYVDKVKY